MSMDPLLDRARALWEVLARVPVSFDPSGGVTVVVSPESWTCLPGWVGVVVLGGSAIVTAPNEATAATVSKAFTSLTVEAMADAETVGSVLPVADVLGPATLGYLAEGDFCPAPTGLFVVDQLPVEHAELRTLEKLAGDQDAGEAGVDEITSPAFVIRLDGQTVAASGYRAWPHQIAHLSVLTAPGCRERGLGRAVASHAVAHALAAGLLPQWRARPIASRRVADALGFRELGVQLSLKLTTPSQHSTAPSQQTFTDET